MVSKGGVERILYIGQSVDVGQRLAGHDRLSRLRVQLAGAGPDIVARATPFVHVYEGKPLAVERALCARFGFPPWNGQDIQPVEGPLRLVVTLRGRDVWSADRHPAACVSGGYAIGMAGRTLEDTEAFEVTASNRLFDAVRASVRSTSPTSGDP